MATTKQKKEKEQTMEDSKNALTTVQNTGAMILPAEFADMVSADSGLGQENMTVEDMAIPRIGIVQSLSPQRQKTKPEYIDGAAEGHIFDNVSKKLFDGEKGIAVVPVSFRKGYLEWVPRSKGGGFAGEVTREVFDATPPNDKGQHVLPNGNEIVPTAEYYVFLIDEETGGITRAVLSMAKTMIKHSKRWNTLINQLMVKNPRDGKMINPPMFYQSYKLTTVPESNESGSWFRWEIKEDKPIFGFERGLDYYNEAKAFREAIAKGEVKVSDQNLDESNAGGAVKENDSDPM